MESKKLINPKRIFTKFSILGSVGLFSFYYVLLLLVTKDFQHPFTQFLDLQPWMSVLIIGFGIQVGLYSLLKKGYRLNLAQKKDTMNSRILVIGLISVVVFGALLLNGKKEDEKTIQGVQSQVSENNKSASTALNSQLKSMGAVEVEVTPVSVEPGSNMIFDVSLNTHSVDLSYDYTKIISVEDNDGNKYEAISWSGGSNGHHLRGEVEIESLLEDARSIKLIINGIDNQNAVFEWEL